MNRFVPIVIGLAVALFGPVSAGTIFRHDTLQLAVGGGEIRADGSIKRGVGFTARRIAVGQYEISVRLARVFWLEIVVRCHDRRQRWKPSLASFRGDGRPATLFRLSRDPLVPRFTYSCWTTDGSLPQWRNRRPDPPVTG